MAITFEKVKHKSQSRLKGLHPVVETATVALIERCYARGVNIVITQGLRTIAEQNGLFAQGRTQAELNKAGLSHIKAQPDKPKVTNARGGTSYHNYGVAIDFALLLNDGRVVSWDTKLDVDKDGIADWMEVVDEANKLGFEWGGDWTSFKDLPHLQITFGLSTTLLRAGQQPAATKVAAAYAVIDKLQGEASEDMSKITELEQVIEEQEGRLAALEKRLNISGEETYAKDYEKAIQAAKDAGIITTSAYKSKIELNVITMLVNVGLANKALISFFKNFKA
ncbi:M15 family metallopeptidase [Paenibacillus sp. IHB B 3415]|uniref:M15 family metallopeptidase n=1 Tax=Paenibacillus sp. IHB B 3415 TaxID=867080 RepID=UPI00062E4993|nr:M15 family metallopeptidase [Paenibacillus sp. IHB B 3415]